ncbi:hypothetical protein CYMTET_37961, partial [Cymbomonas tetramitiformis]
MATQITAKAFTSRMGLPVRGRVSSKAVSCRLAPFSARKQKLHFVKLGKTAIPFSSHVITRDSHSRRSGTKVSASADGDFADYEAKVAFLFPGQGAQTVGMAKELCEEVPAAADLFNKASEILGYDLLQVCTEGPAEKLNSTAVSQPAIYVSSLAAVEKLRASEGGQEIIDSATVACGLSLGEYTALAFAGAMSFEDGLKVVKARGEAMQAAAD